METTHTNDITDLFGPVISSYSRAEALADGVLIDVSEAAREVGLRFPVALTASAYADCVAWTDADDKRKRGRTGQDARGRLHDVVWMLRLAVGRGGTEIKYRVLRVPREGTGVKARMVTLKATCGPGDGMEPVITVDLA